MIGHRIGHYEVTSRLGAGGMGEVYRAHDSKLNRDVALKVLLPVVASDPDRLARFGREAQVLASLNHPNIAGIYGIEEGRTAEAAGQGRTTALVMELVEGPTLADRIAHGPIPLADALAIARQIADALEGAHEQGIVHRDLKPANIKVKDDGTVKVLDFGLAKAMDPAAGSSGSATMSPTISMHATQAGIILGTAAYMSPEQAAGKRVDRRSDLWAFGVVLLEMLTGRQVFTGETVSHVLAAVLTKDPDWAALPATTPASIRRLLQRCLDKDRKRRLDSAADARLEIEDAQATPASASEPTTPTRASTPGLRVAWGAAALLFVAAAIMAALLLSRDPVPAAPTLTYDVSTPTSSANNQFALSPGGTHLASASTAGVWVRPLAQRSGQVIAGTENAFWPFWSADGRFVGFFADGRLKKVDLLGTPPQTLADAPRGTGGSWNEEGVIIFAPSETGPIYRVSAAGGTPSPLTELDASRKEVGHRHPYFLPDGRHFLYVAISAQDDNSGVFLASLDSKERSWLVPTEFRAAFAPPDRLVYVRGTTLMAQRFDPARREVSGDPSPIAEEVGTFGPNSAAGFAVSANGLLAFRKATRGTESYLKWFDRNGQESLAVEAAAAYDNPALSPDGMRIAVAERDGRSSDIWLIDVERGARTRFTSNADLDLDPVWSRDGSKILFRSSGATDLYVKDAGGVQPESVVVETDATKTPCDWSPDGRYLLYAEVDQRTGADLWVAPADGTGKPEVVVRSAFQDSQGRFSPDGRWVAFASSESGRLEVYVQGFPTATNRVTISTAGGVNPRWRGDGKELFFASVDGMMAVDIDVSSAGVLRAGRPVRLFQVPPLNGWDVSLDGKRFLIAVPVDAAATGEMMPITMMANWQTATEGRK